MNSNYHPSLHKRSTIERTIERTQTTTREMTEGEKLITELKALQMVLNGNPNDALIEQCEERIVEISRELAALTEEETRHLTNNVLRAMKKFVLVREPQARLLVVVPALPPTVE